MVARWRGMVCRGLLALSVSAPTMGCSKTKTTDGSSGAGPSAVSAGSAAASAPAGGKYCSLLVPAEVSALSGIAGLQAPDVTGASPVTMCAFSDGQNPMALTLRFETGRTPEDFAEIRDLHDKMGQKTTDLPGLGDAAATFTLAGHNGVTFLHARTVILVSGRAPMEGLIAIARKIIERMG